MATAVQARWWQRFVPTAQGLLEREQSRHFAAQAGPDGQAWAPMSSLSLEISQGQAADRKRKGQTTARVRRTGVSKLLQNTRLLERSVSTGDAQGIRMAGPDWFLMGTRVPYAAAQQLGAHITVSPAMRGYLSAILGRRFNGQEIIIPARPFLGTSERSRQEMGTASAFAMNQTLREAAK
jgi:phage gpG-like protein